MPSAADSRWMRLALRLARRGLGRTSPNPMVGAVIVRGTRLLGQGWHHAAGQAHAEIEAIRDAESRGARLRGATLYVTLEPCCTHGRTPPCAEAIVQARFGRVVVAATDPNPRHAGRGFAVLREAGIQVETGLLSEAATALNQAFNHWIVHRTPFLTVKAAMTLDGKIATASGESQWITAEPARQMGMRLRRAADAIVVGVETVRQDDPSLTVRNRAGKVVKPLPRYILDSQARIPLSARVVSEDAAGLTTVVVTRAAPLRRVEALRKRVRVWVAPTRQGRVDLRWLLKRWGAEAVSHVLVEGGGEVNASFLLGGWARQVAFFYAPIVLGGAASRKAVGGEGAAGAASALSLRNPRWRRVGPDLCLLAEVIPSAPRG